MSRADDSKLSAAEQAALSALADGSLEPERRPEVESWVAASPELTAMLERERHVVGLLQRARTETRAPDDLRVRIAAARTTQTARPPAPAHRRRPAFVAAISAVAVAGVAVVVAVSGGTAAPSVAQAAALALRGSAEPAPATDPAHPASTLTAHVDEVRFPNWSTRLGWKTVGQRTDHLNGRTAVTVYYARGTQTVAYTIVSAPALGTPAAATHRMAGYEFRTLSAGGRSVVTWQRAGHTCVLSAVGTPQAQLLRLASWGESKSRD